MENTNNICNTELELLSKENLFCKILKELDLAEQYLSRIYPSMSIDDMDAYPLQIIKHIIKTSNTLHSVIERDKDYIVANIILRSIVDSLSVLFLIYNERNIEKKILRHYLYIMDGLNGRIKGFPKNIECDKSQQNEYEERCKVIETYRGAYEHSKSKIKKLPFYSEKQVKIDKLINKHNWKFISLDKSAKDINRKDNTYSWKKMYEGLDVKGSAVFSFLSESVHGLSTSNLFLEIEKDTFEPIYGMSAILLDKLNSFIKTYYVQGIAIIKKEFFSDDE